MQTSTPNAAKTALSSLQVEAQRANASISAALQPQQQRNPLEQTTQGQQSQKDGQHPQGPDEVKQLRASEGLGHEERKSEILQKKLTVAIEENVNLQLGIDEAAVREQESRTEIEALKSDHVEVESEFRDGAALYKIMQSIQQSSDAIALAVNKVHFVFPHFDGGQAATTQDLGIPTSATVNNTTLPFSSQPVQHPASNSSLFQSIPKPFETGPNMTPGSSITLPPLFTKVPSSQFGDPQPTLHLEKASPATNVVFVSTPGYCEGVEQSFEEARLKRYMTAQALGGGAVATNF